MASSEAMATSAQGSPLNPPLSTTNLNGSTGEGGGGLATAADSLAGLNSFMSTVPQDSSKIEIKLFVGRVPRHYEEEQLRPEFEEFGQVLEVAVLKDKLTQSHKGSAFVRMASITQADAAIRALNNVKALDPSLGAMQVRYATGEAEKFGFSIDNGASGQDMVKLFVGSLPRSITDEAVTAIFTPFGKIDEVFLLKDPATGLNKGCAFVKFCFKENAIRAIRQLNGNMTIPGGPRPIEVRVAENKKVVPPVSGGMQFPGAMGSRPSVPGNLPLPGMGMAMGAMGLQMQAAASSGQQGSNVGAAAVAASNANPRQGGTWREYFTPDGRPYYHNTVTAVTQWERPQEFDAQKAGGDTTGPPGANIFVFHIPNDWGQGDLIQNFSHFGNIVSARIATDKATNRNKGYAFVSYDNIQSSANAVLHMNGFMACGKRLKVSIKQNEEKYVAHIFPHPSMATGGQSAVQQQQIGPVQGMQTPLMQGANMFPSGQPQVSGASMGMAPMMPQQPQMSAQPQMGQQQAFNGGFGSFPTNTSQRYAPY